ncbi:MAG TPA: hypothetical protein VM370_06385 [Candidatus Thermoplasmatota archaeon]|nr:hypothetical protein [Candidatus Thermoplasmatota archaeon]
MPASTPRAPPAVPTPAPPPAGLVLARWMYVDEAHRHEVHAGVRPGDAPAFVVKESAYQNDRPDEVLADVFPLEAPWEAQLFHWQLECRLALLGRYWRHDVREPGWRPLARPQGVPPIDPREVAVSPYRGRVVFYHFHHRKRHADELLVAIPTATAQGKRYLLALAAFAFPNGADGDVRLLHANLPEAPARSLVVREHMRLKGEGYDKLVWGPDFALAHGATWQREAGQAYEQVLRRIGEGRFGARRDEREDVVDPLYTDFLGALTDPRLLDLQARYLTPEEQEEALAGGESIIRRMIAEKRAGVPHAEQHKLTVVEASLLARDQLRPGQGARVDPEVAALVRRFSYYL